MTNPKDPTPEQIIAETFRQIQHQKIFNTLAELINAKHADAVARKKAEREFLAKSGVPVKEYDAAWEDVEMQNERDRMLDEARRSTDKLCGGPLDQSDSLYQTLGGK